MNESLAKLSVIALKNTIMTLGKQFRLEDWDTTVDFFDRIFRLTTPYNVLFFKYIKVIKYYANL